MVAGRARFCLEFCLIALKLYPLVNKEYILQLNKTSLMNKATIT